MIDKKLGKLVGKAESWAGRTASYESAYIGDDGMLHVGFWPTEYELNDENQEVLVTWSKKRNAAIYLIPSKWHINALEAYYHPEEQYEY